MGQTALLPRDWKHEQWCLDAPNRNVCYCWPPADRRALTLNVAPDRSAASLVLALDPPDGYEFERMDRRGRKAIVVFRKAV